MLLVQVIVAVFLVDVLAGVLLAVVLVVVVEGVLLVVVEVVIIVVVESRDRAAEFRFSVRLFNKYMKGFIQK